MADTYIGGVKLIQSGEAEKRLFSDDEEVKEILRILTEEPREEYSAMISEKKSWPFLLHLSHVRANILRSLEFTQTETVLEIGAGCGTITGLLAETCRSVTGIDPSLLRCRVNAERNRTKKNVTLLAMTAVEAENVLSETFDTVLWIDASPDASEEDGFRMTPEEKLQFVLPRLREGGRLILAVDNRMGLRFLAGEKEDYTGRYFAGIEGYPGENRQYTRSLQEWKKLLDTSCLCGVSFFYPYPDHRFPVQINSDDWLPKAEDLHMNDQNYGRKRLALFDDDAVWRTMLDNGLYPQFANSFLIVCRKREN